MEVDVADTPDTPMPSLDDIMSHMPNAGDTRYQFRAEMEHTIIAGYAAGTLRLQRAEELLVPGQTQQDFIQASTSPGSIMVNPMAVG